MHYYQVLSDGAVIGIATSDNLRRYQEKHRILLACAEDEAQYIEIEAGVFHARWMWKETVPGLYPEAEVTEITEEIYETIKESMDAGSEPEPFVPEEPAPDVSEYPYQDILPSTLEYYRKKKLQEISADCRNAIEEGVNVRLSDGNIHRFSLTIQDQLNMMNLMAMVNAGIESVIYHADGEPARRYSASDACRICNAAAFYKTQLTTYHSCLKQYVLSLETFEEIASVSYGMDIPEEFISYELMSILSGEAMADVYGIEDIMSDELGNKYRLLVNTDGSLEAKLVETAFGELFEE